MRLENSGYVACPRCFDMTKYPQVPLSQVLLSAAAFTLGGCSTGAPSFVLFGAFFPAWLLCGTLGIVGAGVARAAFVASGLSNTLPYQLFVCAAVGVIVALFIWLIGFGQ
jgi:YtcA family